MISNIMVGCWIDLGGGGRLKLLVEDVFDEGVCVFPFFSLTGIHSLPFTQ